MRTRDIGIPVRSVNWVRLHPGHDCTGNECIYATMGQQAASLFVLQIDPATGVCRQFVASVAEASYPTATVMARDGRLYVGAANIGRLLRFDPRKELLDDLGEIHRAAATFPCRMDEDEEGRIWIGSYGTADLTCYDPEKDEFVHHGPMDSVDMYNYPFVNTGGTIANLIRVTRPHVVVYDPKSGARRLVGPVTVKGQDTLDLRRASDGRLYIVSSRGCFRIEGMEAIPVQQVPPDAPAPRLADGTTFSFVDEGPPPSKMLQVCKPGDPPRTFDLSYEASGSTIFCLHRGPDDCLYGSSILPLHLFRYSPDDDELVDLGRCSSTDGEAYSMANLNGHLYISAYSGAKLSVYDPSRTYCFGNELDSNPRDLGRIDDISYRPRSTLAGPLGRVWLASIPDYGRWGGPLSYYDPTTGQKKAYLRIAGDASCYTQAHLEELGLIAVGTTVLGGSGTKPRVEDVVLFLWDYRKEQKAWEGKLDLEGLRFTTVNALLTGPDGRLYGTAIAEAGPAMLFAFDPCARHFNHVACPPGRPLDLGLQLGPDGKVYGFTSRCLYTLDLNSFKVDVVVAQDGTFDTPGPIIGERVYFATNHRLRAMQIL